jgi:hypothetical protein
MLGRLTLTLTSSSRPRLLSTRQLASMTLLPQQLTSALGAPACQPPVLASPQPPRLTAHGLPPTQGLNGNSSVNELKQQQQQQQHQQSQPSSSSLAVQRDPLRNQGPSGSFPFFLPNRPTSGSSPDSPSSPSLPLPLLRPYRSLRPRLLAREPGLPPAQRPRPCVRHHFAHSSRRSIPAHLLADPDPHLSCSAHESLDQQKVRALHQLRSKATGIEKHLFLAQLRRNNVRLFYALVDANLLEITPCIYTPVVGEACERFSELYTEPEGLFISINDAGNVRAVLENWREKDVKIAVVTDGSRMSVLRLSHSTSSLADPPRSASASVSATSASAASASQSAS